MNRTACSELRHHLACVGMRRAHTIAGDATCPRIAAIWAHAANVRRNIAGRLARAIGGRA